MKRFAGLGLALATVLIAGALGNEARGSEAGFSGVVVGYSGSSDCCSLTHRGQASDIAFNMSVYAGDRILVTAGDGAVSVNLANGQMVKVVAAMSPYQVPAVTDERSYVGNMLRLVGERLMRAKKIIQQNVVTQGRTAEAPLSLKIPGLEAGTAVIASGSRPFAINWSGGEPPFSLTVLDGQGHEVVAAKDLSVHEIITREPRNLPPGQLTIRIGDSRNASRTAKVSIVDSTEIPEAPGELRQSWLAPEVRATEIATWLAVSEPPRFSYEAYLELAPFVERSDTAELAMKALATGAMNIR